MESDLSDIRVIDIPGLDNNLDREGCDVLHHGHLVIRAELGQGRHQLPAQRPHQGAEVAGPAPGERSKAAEETVQPGAGAALLLEDVRVQSERHDGLVRTLLRRAGIADQLEQVVRPEADGEEVPEPERGEGAVAAVEAEQVAGQPPGRVPDVGGVAERGAGGGGAGHARGDAGAGPQLPQQRPHLSLITCPSQLLPHSRTRLR